MTSSASLCFHQILGRLKDDEWVWHMIQHMRGARHQDLCCPPPNLFEFIDPVGHSIRTLALQGGYEDLSEEEAKMYEKLVLCALNGDLDDIKANFDSVKALRDPFLDPLQPVTVSGALRGHMHILQFGLDKSAELNKDLAMAIKIGAEKPSPSLSPSVKDYYLANKAIVDEVAQFNPRKERPQHEEEIIWKAIRATDHLW